MYIPNFEEFVTSIKNCSLVASKYLLPSRILQVFGKTAWNQRSLLLNFSRRVQGIPDQGRLPDHQWPKDLCHWTRVGHQGHPGGV